MLYANFSDTAPLFRYPLPSLLSFPHSFLLSSPPPLLSSHPPIQVGEWQLPVCKANQCASTFESGRMTKTRKIKQEPLNGGKACPALSMEYRCPLDACTEKKSTSCSKHATTTYLGRHPVDCPADMALQKIQLRKCEDTSKMRYDYTCVAAQTAGSKKGAAAKSETTNESDAGEGETVNLDKHNVGEKCVAEAAMSGFKLLESKVLSPRSERDTSPSAGTIPRDIAVTGVGAGKAFEMQWDMKVATMNADTVHYATVIGGGDNCRNAKGQNAAPKGRSFLKGYEWLKLGLAKNTWYSYKLSVTETGYTVEANGKVVKTVKQAAGGYGIHNKISLGQHFCAGSKYARGTGEYKNVKVTTEVPAAKDVINYAYTCESLPANAKSKTVGTSGKAKKTVWQVDGGKEVIYLDRQVIECGVNEAIHNYHLERNIPVATTDIMDTSPSAGSIPRDIAVTGVGAGKAFEMQWDMKVATMNADTVHYATVIGGGDNCRNAKGQNAAPKGRSFLKGYEWLKLGLAKNTWYSYKLSVTETGYTVEANGKVVKTVKQAAGGYGIHNKISLGQHFCAGSKYARGTGEYKNVKITTEVPAAPTSNRVRYNYECVTVRDPALV